MTSPSQIRPTLSLPEFVALLGMMFATIAFSIDAMLPALPEIAEELTPENPNLAQLVLTSFVLGMGLGTLLTGPISDALGRKRTILYGAALYILGAGLAWAAPSLEWMLAGRVLQGLGAAGPRIASLALVRDLYSGRDMARVLSYAMLIFTVFPAVAPLLGALIITGFGWRAIFLSFVAFSVISVGWLSLRQAETLPAPMRRPLRVSKLMDGAREALSLRQMQMSILLQTLIFGMLFGTISSIQPVFDQSFGRGDSFPLYFAAIAALSAPAAPINGRLVGRYGMRLLIRRALWAVVASSLAMGTLALSARGGAAIPPDTMFWCYFAWSATLFASLGFTIGNLNALALEPLGHIAGLTASLMGALATVGGAVLGAAIGLMFDGTPLPVILSTLTLAIIGAFLAAKLPRASVA